MFHSTFLCLTKLKAAWDRVFVFAVYACHMNLKSFPLFSFLSFLGGGVFCIFTAFSPFLFIPYLRISHPLKHESSYHELTYCYYMGLPAAGTRLRHYGDNSGTA